MGLDSQLYRNVTAVCKFKMPTPIQRKSIPLILQGLDLVGMARTGSGKTAAFLIPILQRLKGHSQTVGVRCLIVSPSRELTLQSYAVMQKLGKGMGFRAAVVVGGDSISEQFMQLAANPDILLATPGRLVHLLNEVKDFSLQSVEVVVFDEADRLFEMGFTDQIKEITQSMPPERQTLLFSATMPRLLAEFTKSGLHDPEVIRLDADSVLSPDLTLHFLTVRHEDKAAALMYLLRAVVPEKQASIVFCSTKHHVAFLHQLLQLDSIDSAFVYGAMDQSARKIQVAKFRNGRVSVLLVTDVAARGVDLPLIDNVIHFDFPPVPKLFVHRSGRTARAGKTGTAYSLLTKEELPYALDLHLFLSTPIAPAGAHEVDEGATIFGHLPHHELSLLSDVVQRRIQDSEELKSQLRSAENGFKLYQKTRPPASHVSIQRAKQLPAEALHPLFLNLKPSPTLQREIECEAFSQRLKEFRPSASVFDASVAHNRSTAAPPLDSTVQSEVVPVTTKGPELTLGVYRDADFYIHYEKDDRHRESGFSVHSKVDHAVLDLMGEDQEGLAQQRRQYHWDRRSKRYVCLPQGEKTKAGKRVKTESGIKTTKGKNCGKIYEAWTRNQKTKIQTIGTAEDAKLAKRASGALDDVGKRFKKTESGSEKTQDEIMTLEQIKRNRKIKSLHKWKNLPKEKRKNKRRPRSGIQKRSTEA